MWTPAHIGTVRSLKCAPFATKKPTIIRFRNGYTITMYRSMAMAVSVNDEMYTLTACAPDSKWHSTEPKIQRSMNVYIGVNGTASRHSSMSETARLVMKKLVTVCMARLRHTT